MKTQFIYCLFCVTHLNCTQIDPNTKLNNDNIRFTDHLPSATLDIINGLFVTDVVICYDYYVDIEHLEALFEILMKNNIAIIHFNFTSTLAQKLYFDFLNYQVGHHMPLTTLLFTNYQFYGSFLNEITSKDFIQRNIIFIFFWDLDTNFPNYFLTRLSYCIRLFVISKPKNDTFAIHYSQANSLKSPRLQLINWWRFGIGLYEHATIPYKYQSIYKNFSGEVLKIPAIHKPPWLFLRHINDTSYIVDGRDHRLLNLIAQKLNFRFEYIDPEKYKHISNENNLNSTEGVLALIFYREADIFIGDVAMTLERSNYADFSFITLADSGAFITHAPRKLNGSFALISPFSWKVWLLISLTFLFAGPILYIIVTLPNIWRPTILVRSHIRFLMDCSWLTTAILLKQSGRLPTSSLKSRFFIILLSLSSTYLISNMYSANLTSLLATPLKEKPISNLYQLEKAIRSQEIKVFVSQQSSSYGLLQNGSGIYKKLWKSMTQFQSHYILDSVEQGVKLVKEFPKFAVLGGRETLYFNMQRFGSENFYLSRKLTTEYSAIAVQHGCPYIEEINKILMSLFEAGIITKMTDDEYEKLGDYGLNNFDMENVGHNNHRNDMKTIFDNSRLSPINLQMVQGVFYLIFMGSILSGLCLYLELLHYRYHHAMNKKMQKIHRSFQNGVALISGKVSHLCSVIRGIFSNMMNEAYIEALPYTE